MGIKPGLSRVTRVKHRMRLGGLLIYVAIASTGAVCILQWRLMSREPSFASGGSAARSRALHLLSGLLGGCIDTQWHTGLGGADGQLAR